jgi:uncharacterized OB-fold protein
VTHPGPVARNEATNQFFDGTARGEFLLKRCSAGHYSRPQAVQCRECGLAPLEDVPAAGVVRLVSWVVVPGRAGGGERPPELTIPAIVEFDEGPWWWSMLVGADPADLRQGMRLTMEFERPEGSEAIPVFRPG